MSFYLSSTETGLPSKSIFFKAILCETGIDAQRELRQVCSKPKGSTTPNTHWGCVWREGQKLQARTEEQSCSQSPALDTHRHWVTSGKALLNELNSSSVRQLQ